MLNLVDKPDLGYIFYPSKIRHHPGHPQLDIIMTEPPTERHFDPEKAKFQTVSTGNGIETLTIHHPWAAGKSYRVCAGRIFITDRIGKTVEAFSFGGDLEIMSDKDQTLCSLISPAPIFDLCTTHNLPMWLTSEVEILLAKQKAHWHPNHPDAFEIGLAKANPLLLYASCLHTLQQKRWPVNEQECVEGCHFIQEEIARLQAKKLWPRLLPSLDLLLSAP